MESMFFEEKLLRWEKTLEMYHARDRENWLAKAIDTIEPSVKKEILAKTDNVLLYTYHLLQGFTVQKEYRDRIIQLGIVFNKDIVEIEQLKKLSLGQLTSIAENQCRMRKLHAVLNGGIQGYIKPLFMTSFYPINLALQIRTIQLIGLSFGYEMNSPFEMVIALNLFFGATLPKQFQYPIWVKLKKMIQNKDHTLLHMNKEDIILNERWLAYPFNQILTVSIMQLYRKKTNKKIPFISMGIGAFSTYMDIKKLCEFTINFYQYRYLYNAKLMKKSYIENSM